MCFLISLSLFGTGTEFQTLFQCILLRRLALVTASCRVILRIYYRGLLVFTRFPIEISEITRGVTEFQKMNFTFENRYKRRPVPRYCRRAYDNPGGALPKHNKSIGRRSRYTPRIALGVYVTNVIRVSTTIIYIIKGRTHKGHVTRAYPRLLIPAVGRRRLSDNRVVNRPRDRRRRRRRRRRSRRRRRRRALRNPEAHVNARRYDIFV